MMASKMDPARTANQLGFSIRRGLKVHAAESALALVKGNITLDELGGQTVSFKFVLAERTGKSRARPRAFPNR